MLTANTRKRILASLLCTSSVAATFTLGMSSATAQTFSTYQASSSDAFVDSIGVNTHTTYADRSYGNFDVFKNALVNSGIRHIRDGVGTNQNWAVDRLNQLSASGIKLNLVGGRPYNGNNGVVSGDPWAVSNNPGGTIDQLVPVWANDFTPGSIESIEGPNEYDLSKDPNWVANVKTYQNRLYNALKANPKTKNITVIAPSLVYDESRSKVGPLSSDVGNMHNYTGGEQETAKHLERQKQLSSIVSPGKPLWSTETNVHTSLQDRNNQPGVDEKTQSIYTLRQYLEDYRSGIPRTYIYEFMDESNNPSDAEQTWGIVRYDGTPKPAYNSLKNMISLLSDKGTVFSPGKLSYNLEGSNDKTRTLLLQKRDGTFWLALWQEDSIWNTKTKTPVSTSSVPVSINLESSAAVKTYRPSISAKSLSSQASTSNIKVNSGADVTFVQISRPGGTTPTTPAPQPSGSSYKIDAGSTNKTTVYSDVVYDSDKYFVGGKVHSTQEPINVADQSAKYAPIYTTVRYGMSAYNFPVKNGTYDVKIRYVEDSFNQSGQRVFSVSVEGKVIEKDLDIFAQAKGKNKALDKVYRVTATDGMLNLSFAASKDNAVIAGLAVTPV